MENCNNNYRINGSVWDDLMEDALKYPTKTYNELKIPYNFELDNINITDDFVGYIKEIIYDLRKDPSFNHWNAGLHLGMIGITGSSECFTIDYSVDIGFGCPNPSAMLYVSTGSNVVVKEEDYENRFF